MEVQRIKAWIRSWTRPLAAAAALLIAASSGWAAHHQAEHFASRFGARTARHAILQADDQCSICDGVQSVGRPPEIRDGVAIDLRAWFLGRALGASSPEGADRIGPPARGPPALS